MRGKICRFPQTVCADLNGKGCNKVRSVLLEHVLSADVDEADDEDQGCVDNDGQGPGR